MMMHVAVMAHAPDYAETVKSALGRAQHRFTVVPDWPQLLACLQADRPALVVVQRSAFGGIPLADVAQMTVAEMWPPLLIAGREISHVTQGLTTAGRLVEVEPQFYEVGELRIDTRRKRATIGEKWVALPPIQYRLLLTLARRAGEVLNAQELLRIVWGYDATAIEARDLVKVHIRQVRRRLGLDPETHHYIHSVRGFGYVLAPPDEDVG